MKFLDFPTGSVCILPGDSRAALAWLPPGSAQCCVTSPPYFGLRDYGVAGQIGLEPTPDEYVAELVSVFREVRRVLRDDGTLWLNLGDSYASGTKGSGGAGKSTLGPNRDLQNIEFQKMEPRKFACGLADKQLLGIPWRVAFALQADGWYLRSAIIWHKPNPMPESVRDRPTSAYETVFLLTKSPTYYYDAEAVDEDSAYPVSADRKTSGRYQTDSGRKDGGVHRSGGFVTGSRRNARNVWTVTTKPFKGAHFATMPVDIVERCILAGPSAVGCCPTCGAPWSRVVEKGEPGLDHQRACGADVSGGYDGQAQKDYASAGAQNASDVKRRILAGMTAKLTTRWDPGCACPGNRPVPCTVLDPFGGAGTTALAAISRWRSAVLAELNPEYIEIAEKRLTDAAPKIEAAALGSFLC